MKKQSLYRKAPACRDCIQARKIPCYEHLLCKINGLVSEDYCCKNFSLHINSNKSTRSHVYAPDKKTIDSLIADLSAFDE